MALTLPVIPPEHQQAVSDKARDLLWRRSSLFHQLDTTQRKIDQALKACSSLKFFLLCSRRLGKSYYLVNKAVETALAKPRARILYLAPFAKDASEIAGDLAGEVLLRCPVDLKPEYLGQAKEFRFKNDSVIRIKGVNGEHARYLRGGAADLIILDECGIMDDLKHVLSDVCVPMTMTTHGRIILATTPARSPSHESTKIYEDLSADGASSTFTILDNPRVDDHDKIRYLVEAGETVEQATKIILEGAAPTTTTAKREYFCEFVTDADSAVVPEFTAALAKEITRVHTAPPYYDSYVSIDPGFNDRTGILFAYWDFVAGKLIIQDEKLLSHANTADIATAVRDTEKTLWGGKPPLARISDVDLRLIADLWTLHGISCRPTKKEDSLGAINLMRNMIQSRQIIIAPNCVHLIRQLKNATWNNKATDFEQGGDIDGHYDLVAALKYLCRNIMRSRNPYPSGYFEIGGPGGLPTGTYVSHKLRKPMGLGLLSDSPFSRRIIKHRK